MLSTCASTKYRRRLKACRQSSEILKQHSRVGASSLPSFCDKAFSARYEALDFIGEFVSPRTLLDNFGHDRLAPVLLFLKARGALLEIFDFGQECVASRRISAELVG
jgi:hypothetical protein